MPEHIVLHKHLESHRALPGTAGPAETRSTVLQALHAWHMLCFHKLVALRLSAASTRPALVVDCGVFRKHPCLQTRCIAEVLQTLPWGFELTPRIRWDPLGVQGRTPEFYSNVFDL
jgi:hypothetical protein